MKGDLGHDKCPGREGRGTVVLKIAQVVFTNPNRRAALRNTIV